MLRLQPLTGSRVLLTMTSLTCLATTVACGGGGSPELSGLTDTVAQVGTELKIDLNGTDPDGDKLAYGFNAADLPDAKDHAQVTVSPSGAGVFRWTPLSSDIGQHSFDFTASDGSNTTTDTITIDVKSAIGNATAPLFRQPLGTGTTIDLVQKKCVDLSIVIEDQDTAQTTITQEDPVIEGATLSQEDGLTATWHWCPTKDQENENRYTLVLAADDGDNPKTIKNYLVVLRGGSGSNCPGSGPVIAHTPSNETTILDLTIDAQVTDDKGLKDAPLFYYSETQPANPPLLSSMTQLTALQIGGTLQSGQWAADVPNPVAGMPAGTTKTLYYVFVADDDDDTMGNCDHSTTSQVFSMTVTSNGSADLPACSSCTADAQCGSGAECVFMGNTGDSFCLQSCSGGCPSGFSCSAAPVYSVDGAEALQCVPQSGSCAMPTGSCADDTKEENDTRSQASANPALPAGELFDLVSCPSTTGTNTDDDWYKIVLTTDSNIDIQMAGDAATDLDLHLYKSDQTVVSASTSFTPNEEIKKCLKAATYYIKVNGYGHARNPYLLEYDLTAAPGGCDTTCVDDSHEDDDTFSQARETTYPTFNSTANKTCKNDDDWYHVPLFTGDVMTVDLTFTQSDSTQDLDLHLYRDSIDLTPCDTSNPSTCSTANGQGASSNEHTTFTAPAGCSSGCDYYVVVRGYNGSTNSYAINIGIQ
jgi:hypothetical protein